MNRPQNKSSESSSLSLSRAISGLLCSLIFFIIALLRPPSLFFAPTVGEAPILVFFSTAAWPSPSSAIFSLAEYGLLYLRTMALSVTCSLTSSSESSKSGSYTFFFSCPLNSSSLSESFYPPVNPKVCFLFVLLICSALSIHAQ